MHFQKQPRLNSWLPFFYLLVVSATKKIKINFQVYNVIMTANARLEIQDIIEKILYKRCVDPGGHKYDFRLRMPTYFDHFTGNMDSDESVEKNGYRKWQACDVPG